MTTIGFKENSLESSCGSNSGWKFCSDNKAIVVGFGINLVHSATIMHSRKSSELANKDWFEKINVRFKQNVKKHVSVKMRKSKWKVILW